MGKPVTLQVLKTLTYGGREYHRGDHVTLPAIDGAALARRRLVSLTPIPKPAPPPPTPPRPAPSPAPAPPPPTPEPTPSGPAVGETEQLDVERRAAASPRRRTYRRNDLVAESPAGDSSEP